MFQKNEKTGEKPHKNGGKTAKIQGKIFLQLTKK
jgi:hypothetical protein